MLRLLLAKIDGRECLSGGVCIYFIFSVYANRYGIRNESDCEFVYSCASVLVRVRVCARVCLWVEEKVRDGVKLEC